jgi:hypothetical protein
MKLRDVHESSLATSTALSSYAMPDAVPPLDVVSVLNEAGVSFVLVGAHGLGGWMNEPRATQDVDVVVATRHHKKAVKALTDAFNLKRLMNTWLVAFGIGKRRR